MINGGIIDNWACVSFSRIPPEEVHRFCCDLIQMCNMTGMVKGLHCFPVSQAFMIYVCMLQLTDLCFPTL